MVLAEDVLTIKWSLRTMRQLRFCPPSDKLIQEHLNICPYCGLYEREEEEVLNSENRLLWYPSRDLDLEARRGEEDIEHSLLPSEVVPGQIWQTSEMLAGYGEGYRYHNTALVIVTEVISEGIVRVALIHMEEELAFEGDVEALPGVFAEMWNTFPFPVKYLAKYIKSANPPQSYSGFADPPTIIHHYFRKMEAEVASLFVFKTFQEILQECGQDVADMIESEKDYQIVIDGVELPRGIASILDRLALASPWDSSAAMAAVDSGDENSVISVNVAVLSGSRVYLRATIGHVTFWHENEGEVVIGGRVFGEFSSDSGIHALWKHREAEDILARGELVSFDPQSGYFRVVFPALSESTIKEGIVALLICTRKI